MVNRVLYEQGFQLSGIVDSNTSVRIGELLEAQVIIKAGIGSNKGGTLMPIGIGILGWYTASVNAHVINIEQKKAIAVILETDRSYIFGIPATITYGGKTRDDVIGIKRSKEDMFNAALRGAVDDVSISVIKAVYKEDK
jgi:hypothetical protein